MSSAIEIFCCYSRKDQEMLENLKAHLAPLRRQGLITIWNDTDITPGTNYEEEIKKHLDSAHIILLLVSPDFMNSDYCYSTEMDRAMERHTKGEARVVPIILRPVLFKDAPFGKIQALPTDAKPVKRWADFDDAFFNVAEGIKQIAEKMALPSQQGPQTTEESGTGNLTLYRTLKGHLGPVKSVALSLDGQVLVSGSDDNTIKVWDLHTGKELRTLRGHTDGVWSVALDSDGHTLVSGSIDRTIKVWDLHTGKEIRTCIGHSDEVNAVLLSTIKQVIISGSDDNTIKVWDLHTGKELRTLRGHTNAVWSIALSADGQTLVSGSEDHKIKVWNAQEGRHLQTLIGHSDSVLSVALSANGKILVSGSKDETIKVWDIEAGKELRTLIGHTGPIWCVMLSEDEQVIASGSVDGTIKIWGKP